VYDDSREVFSPRSYGDAEKKKNSRTLELIEHNSCFDEENFPVDAGRTSREISADKFRSTFASVRG
jgi:hypothetical protein